MRMDSDGDDDYSQQLRQEGKILKMAGHVEDDFYDNQDKNYDYENENIIHEIGADFDDDEDIY